MLAKQLQRHYLPRAIPSMRYALPLSQLNTAKAIPLLRPQLRMFSAPNNTQDGSEPSAETVEADINQEISQWIKDNDVCVFIKGSRKMPQCGFSKYVVALLHAYEVKTYKDVNVLADNELREAIKVYSNWPTLPQVYVKGQFVGGYDIMKEMHEDGSLREFLIEQKIIKE